MRRGAVLAVAGGLLAFVVPLIAACGGTGDAAAEPRISEVVVSRSATATAAEEPPAFIHATPEAAAIAAAREGSGASGALTAREFWRFPQEGVYDARVVVNGDAFCRIYGAGGQEMDGTIPLARERDADRLRGSGADALTAVQSSRRSKAKQGATKPKRSRKRRAASRARLTPAEIIERLDAEAPIPPWRAHGDAMAELVLTLLSQNTSDTNSGRAYQALIARYPTWDAVLAAPTREVEKTIRIGGLAKTKAPRMQALVAELRERLGPEWDARQLKGMRLKKAKEWLTSLPGVGSKTAACVLLFALGRPALPVDTHVHRVAQRLGLIDAKTGAAAAHEALEAQMTSRQYYRFHVSVIRHGRRVCKAGRPLCGECVLADQCPSAFMFDGSGGQGS